MSCAWVNESGSIRPALNTRNLERHLQFVPSRGPIITNYVRPVDESVSVTVSIFFTIPPDYLKKQRPVCGDSELICAHMISSSGHYLVQLLTVLLCTVTAEPGTCHDLNP